MIYSFRIKNNINESDGRLNNNNNKYKNHMFPV